MEYLKYLKFKCVDWQIKRDQVVQCLGELIALNSEVANLVTDIIASKNHR